MRCKLFAVVKGQCLDSFAQGLEVVHNGGTNQVRGFIGHLGQDGIPTLALDHGDDRAFVVCAYHRVALPMAYLLSRLNMQGSIAQGSSVGDLSPTIPSTRITLPLLLLAAQVLPKCSPP